MRNLFFNNFFFRNFNYLFNRNVDFLFNNVLLINRFFYIFILIVIIYLNGKHFYFGIVLQIEFYLALSNVYVVIFVNNVFPYYIIRFFNNCFKFSIDINFSFYWNFYYFFNWNFYYLFYRNFNDFFNWFLDFNFGDFFFFNCSLYWHIDYHIIIHI